MQPKNHSRSKGAFLLLELIVVIAVIGIIGAIAISAMQHIFSGSNQPNKELVVPASRLSAEKSHQILLVGEVTGGWCSYIISRPDDKPALALGDPGFEKGDKVQIVIPGNLHRAEYYNPNTVFLIARPASPIL